MWLSAVGARASEHAVAVDADGKAHVAFVRDGELLLRTRPEIGTYGPPRPLAAAGANASGPRLAAAPDGRVEIAWTEDRPGEANADVLARTLNADSTLADRQPLGIAGRDFPGASPVQLAAGSEGRSVAIWWALEAGQTAVRVQRRTPTTLAAPERAA